MSMSNNLRENGVPIAQAKRALERVLASRSFLTSSRLSEFLRYTVEQTLSGNADQLKEYTIGTQAYGRKTDFDPSHDTIVRTEARRLRRKLVEYYEGDGRNDDVLIFFRSGSYVPVIHWRDAVEGSVPSADQAKPLLASALWTEGDGIWVITAPFAAPPDDAVASSFAFGLEDEILHRMVGLPGIRTFTENASRPAQQTENAVGASSRTRPLEVSISGTVRTEHDRLRVTARVTTSTGLVLWSQRYDTGVNRESLLEVQEAIAAALLNHIAPREPLVQQFSQTPTEALYKIYAEVLAAESLLEDGSIPNTLKALAKFEQLKAKIPHYPRLDCGIAQCCIGLAHRGDVASERLLERALTIGQELLQKWPNLPEAHSIVAMTAARERNWQKAEESFQRALTLGRQHAIHRQFAVYLLVHGRFHEAWDHLQVAQSIDRFSNRQKTSMGHFFYCSRWHDEARTYYGDAVNPAELQIEPAYFYALTQIEMGQLDNARAVAARLEKVCGAVPTYLTGIAEIFVRCGEMRIARELIARGGLLNEEATVSSYRQGCLALALQDTDFAIDCLKKSLRRNEPEILWLRVEPRFDAIKTHPIYEELCRIVYPE